VVQFALAWNLARETGSALVLSTALIVATIPNIVLGPFVGPFVDRWSRKQIMIFSDLLTAVLTAVLVVLFATGSIQVWHIYLIMAGRAIGDTFQNPALMASIPMLVPEKQLVRANGFFQMLQSAIKIVAPIAGAFFMELWSMHNVLMIDIVTAAIAIVCLLPLVIPCSIGIGLTSISYFYTTVIAMIFMGVGMAFSSAPLAAIQNAVIARDMQVRVFSLFNSVVILMMPLGLLVGAPVAETFGIRWLYFIASAAWLIILPVALCSKPLMNLENQPAEAVTV
jgi:MFS family permease